MHPGLLLETPWHPAKPETEQGPHQTFCYFPCFKTGDFWQPNLRPLKEPTERLEGEEEGEQPYISGTAEAL